MRLVNVYKVPSAKRVLYELLKERTADQSISHKNLPTWEEHVSFFNSHPYHVWYLIEENRAWVGAIYITNQREVGLFIFNAFHRGGHGSQALCLLRQKHPGKLLANINPKNEESKRFFKKHGFRFIQETYESDA